MNLAKFFKNKSVIGLLSSGISVVVGLLFGLIILFISNPSQAINGFTTILSGGFTDGAKGIGQVFYYATPIIMTGLSVGFAFKTGLFNIGAPGQFVMGAFGTVYVGVMWTWLPSSIHWIVALLVGAILGGIWALIPGILKACFNVNEVISCIMSNYIGMYAVNLMVKQTVYDSLRNQSKPVASSAIVPKFGLDKIFTGSGVNGGIIIAVVIAIIIYIVLNKTTFGYELKACGYNPFASQYAGINAKRNIIFSMAIAGCLAGIGGGLLYLAGTGKYLEVVDVLAAEGFNGIPVALLGMSNPIGIIIAGIFIAYITVGGFYMQLYDFAPQIIDIIIAAIIYFSAFSLIFKSFVLKMGKDKSGGKK
ncbi:MAG: ABC transporter permease [Oscillospiraceae bacterium]